MPNLQSVFLYNKANEYGLQQDVEILSQLWTPVFGVKPRPTDPLEPPLACDIAVHFEVPYYGWMPWARFNVFVINPEWWEDAWNPYLKHADLCIFKCEADRNRFFETRPECNSVALPWTTAMKPADFAKDPRHKDGILWLLGASRAKRAAAEKLLPLWQESWPTLEVYTTTPLAVTQLAANVKIHISNLDSSNRRRLQSFFPTHFIFSEAEALSMSAMESLASGARIIGNGLPVFLEAFSDNTYVYLTEATLEPHKASVRDTFSQLASGLSHAMKWLILEQEVDEKTRLKFQERFSAARLKAFQEAATQAATSIKTGSVLKERKSSVWRVPPVLSNDECPPISVITLLHNRRKFVDLAIHNLLLTDYPKDKIEWVVVEDSDNVDEQASDKIIKFGREAAPMSVTYVPLQKKTSIGAKRNLGCKRAQNDIILMMDDDDHYPPTSFRRRVAWLVKHPWSPLVTVGTTLACYDLLKGTSAVNTPPWNLGLAERCSEATLTFKKSFWDTAAGSGGAGFPETSVSEGEGFLKGFEESVLELPPQQLIVAMSHGKNTASRRIPPGPSGKPSCFWGFPKEFLVFLHRLAGVELEEAADRGAPSAK